MSKTFVFYNPLAGGGSYESSLRALKAFITEEYVLCDMTKDDDYEKIIKLAIDKLGYERMKNVHIHFSKIEYTLKGEVKHLTFEDTVYGPEFLPLAKVIKKHKLEPMIICESKGTQTRDAILMKEMYNSVI